MCGIIGVYNYSGPGKVDEKLIVRMRDTMPHRGPDDAGVYLSRDMRLGLGHRRLSIIDLSPAGHQPMCNEDGTLWIIYNGEIYNYRTLAAELAARGHVFRSRSDTEVLLHLFEDKGMDFVHCLEGMFAIALWDEKNSSLMLLRDRIGVKPLYYYHKDGVFIFASEIKAILAHPAVSRDIDEEALYHYLTFVTTPPPLTLFANIKKLPPGTSLTISSDGTASIKEYWDPLIRDPSPPLDEEEYISEIQRLLKEAIQKRMVSDVPFGVFLSGGIDSSTNVSLMSQLMDRPVETFTVGFKGEDVEKYNELEYARQIAKEFRTNHHEVIINSRDLSDYIPKLIFHQDEPIADPVCVPLYYISKLARDSGVIVVQVGEGSDELFCGYDNYMMFLDLFKKWWLLYNHLPLALRRAFYGAALRGHKWTGRGRMLTEVMRRAANQEELFWGGAIAFTETDKESLLTRNFRERHRGLSSFSIIKRHFDRVGELRPSGDFLQRLIYLDMKLRLPELLLMRVDKVTMSTSVEARVPFLDHKLIELAMDIPTEIKIRTQAKHILKKAVEGLIPQNIINRKKQGFAAPIHEWFLRELKDYLEFALFDSAFRKRGLINYRYVTNLFETHQKGKRDYSFQLWNLFNLSQWYDYWIEGKS